VTAERPPFERDDPLFPVDGATPADAGADDDGEPGDVLRAAAALAFVVCLVVVAAIVGAVLVTR
jgi:hypothetical protein